MKRNVFIVSLMTALFLPGARQALAGTIPPTPSNVNAVAGNGLASFILSVSTAATSYHIYESTSPSLTKSTGQLVYTYVPNMNALAPVISGLTNGTTYYFAVTALNASGESSEAYTYTIPRATLGMVTPRMDQAMTALPDGRLLVVGGRSNLINLDTISQATSTAEIFDPSTQNWSAAGSMSEPRFGHTATLLQNGKVLVAGGLDNTAEIYDPSTNQWTLTGPMSTARYHATATLLPNGKVLVAGGCNPSDGSCTALANTSYGDGGSPLSSAEIYNPALGAWSPAGTMSVPRVYHTATLLSSGKVLVVGGDFVLNSPYPDLVDLFDPASNTWSQAAPLLVDRDGHTATTLPNGDILVAGGENLNISGAPGEEIYHVATDSWSITGSLTTPRVAHNACILTSGKVLVAGGAPTLEALYSSAPAEVYDPTTGTWASGHFMDTSRYASALACLPSGLAVVVGGIETNSYTNIISNTAQYFNPTSGQWYSTTPFYAYSIPQVGESQAGNVHLSTDGYWHFEETSAFTYILDLLQTGGATSTLYIAAITVSAQGLPSGMALADPYASTITGSPTSTGTYSATLNVSAINVPGPTLSVSVPIKVFPPLSLTAASLPSGAVGVAYLQSVLSSGGDGPFIFTVSSGQLPPGLSISTAGVISGTPTAGGSYGFGLTLTDNEYISVAQNYVINVSSVSLITISVSTTSVNFQYKMDDPAPPDQFIDVTSLNPSSNVAYTVTQFPASSESTCSWLLVTPNGATPGTITLSPDTSGLSTGTYPCNVRISAPSASNSVVLVPATLTVSPAPGPAPLPPPVLNLPATMPIDSDITLGIPDGVSFVRFDWSITKVQPNSSVNVLSAASVIARTDNATFHTEAPKANAATQGLTPGYCSVQVTAYDSSGNPSLPAQAFTTFVSDNLSGVKVHPSPWRSDLHTGHPLTFDNLPAASTIKIFTISGHWVKTISNASGQTPWDLKNDDGNLVASGLYLYLVTDGQGGKTHGKFGVIR